MKIQQVQYVVYITKKHIEIYRPCWDSRPMWSTSSSSEVEIRERRWPLVCRIALKVRLSIANSYAKSLSLWSCLIHRDNFFRHKTAASTTASGAYAHLMWFDYWLAILIILVVALILVSLIVLSFVGFGSCFLGLRWSYRFDSGDLERFIELHAQRLLFLSVILWIYIVPVKQQHAILQQKHFVFFIALEHNTSFSLDQPFLDHIGFEGVLNDVNSGDVLFLFLLGLISDLFD